MAAVDAVAGSSTGTEVYVGAVRAPLFGGAKHAAGHDNRSRHRTDLGVTSAIGICGERLDCFRRWKLQQRYKSGIQRLRGDQINGGQLDGTRILSRTTVALMTSDPLGSRIATPFGPGELLLGTPGYTFGLGFAVRPSGGIAGVPGSAGEFMWAGYAGTYFWVDPKEELTAIYMSQAPSPIRAYYRKLVKQLVYGALTD